MGLEVATFIGRCPAQACHVIQHARAFIGYQSGLSILADNFDTPQVMLYFDILERLMYAWPKPGNIANRSYRPFLFAQTPTEVAAQLGDFRLRSCVEPAKMAARPMPINLVSNPTQRTEALRATSASSIPITRNRHILLTCELGDFFAMEALLSPRRRPASPTSTMRADRKAAYASCSKTGIYSTTAYSRLRYMQTSAATRRRRTSVWRTSSSSTR